MAWLGIRSWLQHNLDSMTQLMKLGLFFIMLPFRANPDPPVILIVDDDAFNREGLRLYLERKGFVVVEAGDAATAYHLAEKQLLAAVVVDIVIPSTAVAQVQPNQSQGIVLAERLKHRWPDLGIILFSAHEDRGRDVWEMVYNGKRGLVYKLKGCSPRALLTAIEDARSGRVSIDPEVLIQPHTLAEQILVSLGVEERLLVETAVGYIDELTPREKEIAQRLAAAHTISRIAHALNISTRTVENHIRHIYSKLALNDLAETPSNLRRSIIMAKAYMVYDLRTGTAS